MEKQILITASIGLILCKGKYYLQIIPSESEKQIIVPITKLQADNISETEDLVVETIERDKLNELIEPTAIPLEKLDHNPSDGYEYIWEDPYE